MPDDVLSLAFLALGLAMATEAEKNLQGKSASTDRTQFGEICPICLDPVSGEAFLDQCFHKFCYHCILQWSEMVLASSLAKSGNPKRVSSLECPLCKTQYISIIHDFITGTRYQRHFLLSSDGSQFRLSESHKRRQAVYLDSKSEEAANIKNETEDTELGLEAESITQDPKTQNRGRDVSKLGLETRRIRQGVGTRNISGIVKTNKWLPSWVRRELQALMQEEDVEMVTHHIAGVVESLQKRERGSQAKATYKIWHDTVASAARPFVFENAEKFTDELWKFLDAGLDIAFYDQQLLSEGRKRNEVDASTGPVQGSEPLKMYDEDLESF